MRGDSIRDLYAKTLALLGLGVLAGTGALVDYWPAGVRLPVVQSGLLQPEPALALAVPAHAPDFEIRREPPRASLSRRPALPSSVNLAALMLPIPPDGSLEPLTGDVIQTVSFSHPATATLVPVAFAHQDLVAPLGQEVSLSEPSSTWTEAPLTMTSAPVALSASDDHGVISGVVRATKSSLIFTGRKTGASIIGAFRAVSGVVKKALPN